jgi:hypothetical protein
MLKPKVSTDRFWEASGFDRMNKMNRIGESTGSKIGETHG